jgi:hypothetical protein
MCGMRRPRVAIAGVGVVACLGLLGGSALLDGSSATRSTTALIDIDRPDALADEAVRIRVSDLLPRSG